MSARRRRRAGAIALAGALCLLLVPQAGAAEPELVFDSYRAQGTSRGIEFSFTFTGSLFEPLLHIGIPYARTDIRSEAGATSDAVAGQVYPGDLIASQAGDRFPGVAAAGYPPGAENVKDLVPFPGAGPVQTGAGHVEAAAAADRAFGLANTASGAFVNGEIPLVSARSVRVTSEGTRTGEGVVQTVRSVVNGLEVNLADGFAIRIESVISSAMASSDGTEGETEAHLTLGDVVVELGGETFPASIDDRGLHLPDPLQDVAGVPLDLEQTIRAGLRQAGISITTAGPVEIVEGSSADASVGGLVIGLTGEIPVVPVPQAFAQLVGQIQGQLPSEVNDPICFQEDLSPDFPLPLCVSPQLLPGPGSGMTQTLSLGNVNAFAAASLAPPPVDDGTIGGGGPFENPPIGPGPDLGPTTAPPGEGDGNGDGSSQPGRLTGLLARMPPGVLLAAGIVLLLAAGASTAFPFRKPWREIEP